MKELLKRLLPMDLIDGIRDAQSEMRLLRESGKQRKRFLRNYSRRSCTKAPQIESRIIFFTHQIEKGLSHSDFRYGFGRGVMPQLSAMLQRLQKADEDYLHNSVYVNAIAALSEYRRRHEAAKYDIGFMAQIFPSDIWAQVKELPDRDYPNGGSLVVRASDKPDGLADAFTKLSEARHSIREFSDEPVTEEQILAAARMAMRTPTVCNRQSTRLHVMLDGELIKQALELQGGFKGFATPPALILVTADNQVFMNPDERNEGFVDGGLFGMSLLYALEASGLAACPLNTMLPSKRDDVTRDLLHIPDSEFFVMYIAVGHFLPEVRTCVSKRFDAEDILTFVKE